MKMKISDLRERIQIIGFTAERDERGDVISTLEFERCRVWANVYALTARINNSPPERTNKINYRVTIRHRDDLKPDDEIVWRNRRLKLLTPPFDLDGKRIFTAFDCEEVVEDGAT